MKKCLLLLQQTNIDGPSTLAAEELVLPVSLFSLVGSCCCLSVLPQGRFIIPVMAFYTKNWTCLPFPWIKPDYPISPVLYNHTSLPLLMTNKNTVDHWITYNLLICFHYNMTAVIAVYFQWTQCNSVYMVKWWSLSVTILHPQHWLSWVSVWWQM